MYDIQDIMFAMEEEWNEQESDAKQEFQSLRDEIKNKVRKQYLNYSCRTHTHTHAHTLTHTHAHAYISPVRN